ncbi:polysaccharide ABC transporter ATP-binding protein [Rhabdothermincola salaria]|uniref:ABC transporter ATP-binding protein n=1 Tax=Rhabdothermincola salaria TaxID=2903142 RepID=UPI001E396200|nr:polysaccharide ABC transporter ATP-binding protein [Rhabdothermincola salaria]MCD9622740.1 polysaccharide ABC transporter ATP-binding protein [Rhabdothermincola salaria]
MSSDLAIRVEGLSKAYTIRHHHNDHITLAQVALDRLRHPLRRSQTEEFWALRDISLDVPRGEVMGVIGRNGAGKSTLLKLLTRITGPTAGRIDLWGRIGSLLEVGTGFHPELTGRENIYLNGAILGMRRTEIDRQFDAIVDFAGIERFLDTPVKRYSSGMYVRLAFAVAAHLQTEILLVDEVLAVGDQEFQAKCLGKMHDVAADGRTVLFVSHQLDSVARLCTSAMVLVEGRRDYLGPVDDAIAHYLDTSGADTHSGEIPTTRARARTPVAVTSVAVVSEPTTTAAPKRVRFSLRAKGDDRHRVYVQVVVRNRRGEAVVVCDSRHTGDWFEVDGHLTAELTIATPWLVPGTYHVSLEVGIPYNRFDLVENVCSFEVPELLPYPHPAGTDAITGQVLADFSYRQLENGPPVQGGGAVDTAARDRDAAAERSERA